MNNNKSKLMLFLHEMDGLVNNIMIWLLSSFLNSLNFFYYSQLAKSNYFMMNFRPLVR